jgi:radical SAM protein with 4Fe4S-binding SPASM domain
MTYPRGFMEFAIYKKIIDEIASKKLAVPVTLKLYFLGEPLLHRQLHKMLQYTKKQGISAGITTNGLLLNQHNIPWLLANVDQIGISIEGADAATYEQLRLNSNYTRVVENIKKLCLTKEKLGNKTTVRLLTLMPEDDVEAGKWISAIVQQWQNYDVKIAPLERQPHENTSWLGKPSVISEVKRTVPCEEGLNSLVVRWDGETTFCCGDVNTLVSLGNVCDKTLQEMWVSDKMWQIRNSLLKLDFKSIPTCRECMVTGEIRHVWRISVPEKLFRATVDLAGITGKSPF